MGFFDGILSTVSDVATALDPFSGALKAGAGLIGGMMTNASNQQIAQSQQQFQAGQSATSYQRAVADMQAAGLSPMLAYSQGGASTPTGASIAMQNPVPQATQAYEESRMNTQQLENLRAQRELTKAQELASISQAKASAAQAEKTIVDMNNSLAMLPWNIENVRSSSRVNSANAFNAERGIAPSPDPYWYRDTKRVLEPVVQPAGSALQNWKHLGEKLQENKDRLFRKGK